MNPWTRLASRYVYRNPWIGVREDDVLRPDGKPGIYGVVEIKPSVAVLALDDQDRLALVGQWRYTRGRYSWEVPLGGAHEDETDMLQVAIRELREETGASTHNWQFLGTLEACIGVTTDTQHIYLASNVTKLPSTPDPDEKLELRWVPFAQAVNLVLDGEICEAASTAAILKLDALRRYRNGEIKQYSR